MRGGGPGEVQDKSIYEPQWCEVPGEISSAGGGEKKENWGSRGWEILITSVTLLSNSLRKKNHPGLSLKPNYFQYP